MRGGGSKAAFLIGAEPKVDIFERAEKPDEQFADRGGPLQSRAEIAVPKLIAQRHHRRAHGTVFVRSLRPNHLFRFIHPDGKTQLLCPLSKYHEVPYERACSNT